MRTDKYKDILINFVKCLLMLAFLAFLNPFSVCTEASQSTKENPAWVDAMNRALDEYKRDEEDEVSDLVTDLLQDYTSYEMVESAAFPGANKSFRWANNALKVVNTAEIVQEAKEVWNYKSPHKHGLFKVADNVAKRLSFAVTTATDLAGELIPGNKGAVLNVEYNAIKYGYDFIDTDVVVNTLNNSDNWLIQSLDYLTIPIQSFFDEDGHLFIADNPIDFASHVMDTYQNEFEGRDPYWERAGRWFYNNLKIQYRNRVPQWVNAYKPNIYLYGDAGTEVDIEFVHPERLRNVIPEYSEQWKTIINEDGQLTVNGVSGFSYLFYESVTEKSLLQTDTGFAVPSGNRKDVLKKIMEEYGFNQVETDDFVEYWSGKLDDNADYIACPQNTEVVEKAMPIRLNGTEIDSCFRLWFYFVEDTGQEYKAPKVEQIERTGTTLVEWGGVIE